MMTLCKTVHTLLGFPVDRRGPPHHCRNIPPSDAGGLRLLSGNRPKPPHVVESSAVGPTRRLPEREEEEADPGGWGLYELEDHGGMGLCTESLGFESCDDSITEEALLPAAVAVGADEDEIAGAGGRNTACHARGRAQPGRRLRAEGEPKFPPPLPWLDGRRSCFLRGIRKDGRLQLTEVTIERPEVLRASRQDGRLRLHLVSANAEEIPTEEPELDSVEEDEEEVMRGEMEEDSWWELPRLQSEVGRCQDVAGGNPVPHWWSHRFVTTA